MTLKILIFFVPVFLFLSVSSVFAENNSAYITAPLLQNMSIAAGSNFEADVMINEQNSVNAFDFIINYPKDKAQFLSVDKTNSIADIWTNSYSNSSGQIFLSGGISKSFSGKRGLIAGLRFKAINPGNLSISFSQSNVYAADGLGTKIKIESTPILLSVTAENTIPNQVFQNENSSVPTILDFQIIKNLADGFSLASFRIQNESPANPPQIRVKKWFFWESWHVAQSPTPLPNDAWAVELKVSNSSGEADKVIYDFGMMFKKLFLLLLGVAAFIALLIAIIKIYNYNKNSRAVL